MDSGQNTFLTPTICFSAACVAFSFLALSAVWKNQQQLATSIGQPRPKAVRRRAVDSIYVPSEARDNLHDHVRISASQLLPDLIRISTSTAFLLNATTDDRSPSEASPKAALLNELSSITFILCRLQQQGVRYDPSKDTTPQNLHACLDATLLSLQETLQQLETGLPHAENRSDHVLTSHLQQLRDQRPSLEFLVESTEDRRGLPPTPPADGYRTAFMGDAEVVRSAMLEPPSTAVPTGLTPSMDTKSWIEPPPEYSPPAVGFNIAPGSEKKSEPIPASTIEDRVRSSSTTVRTVDAADSAILAAISAHDLKTLRHLLKANRADLHAQHGESRRTALHHAAQLNASASIPHLLHGGALLTAEDAGGDTPLHLAAWSGHVEALTAMLTYHNTAVISSSNSDGFDEVVNYLSGKDGYTPLFIAATASHIPAVRLLLSNGADPNIASLSHSTGGTTALHQASISGSSELCSLLLAHGAKVDTADEEGNTALHYAATCGSVPCVKVLLRAGADAELQQTQGLTAVHWAAHKGHTEVLRLLLEWWEDGKDARAEEGATPLHLAANRGHVGSVKALLERGALPQRRAVWDGSSGTAADMARAKGHLDAAEMIERH